MAREKGFIYYEADCMLQLINPFVDIHAKNPFMAAMQSKPLKVGATVANAVLPACLNEVDKKSVN